MATWITRQNLHLDRVASAWLIRRFVDHEAVFLFTTSYQRELTDATPFGISGLPLGPHDADGLTFAKIMARYGLADEALAVVCEIMESAVKFALSASPPDYAGIARLEAVGVNALCEGLIVSGYSDDEILSAAFPLYDALYAYCRASLIEQDDPTIRGLSLRSRLDVLTSRVGPIDQS
jgi:hypothetical protein